MCNVKWMLKIRFIKNEFFFTAYKKIYSYLPHHQLFIKPVCFSSIYSY